MNNRFLSFMIIILLCTTPALFMVRDCQAMPQITNLAGQVIEGTVVETMNTGHYTFLLLKTDEKETWVVIPQTDTIVKGGTVTIQPGMTMKDFKSRTLNRTFATILFSTGLVEYADKKDTYTAITDMEKAVTYPESPEVADNTNDISFAVALQTEQNRMLINQKMSDMAAEISGGSLAAIQPAKGITIERASGENSYTIEECFKKRNELNTQTVQVRGKVVRISKRIMGKNWIHLQDGTGDPMKHTHNLVFTTQEVPELNSIITMEGVLHADQDFGSGYEYKAIIKDAIIL